MQFYSGMSVHMDEYWNQFKVGVLQSLCLILNRKDFNFFNNNELKSSLGLKQVFVCLCRIMTAANLKFRHFINSCEWTDFDTNLSFLLKRLCARLLVSFFSLKLGLPRRCNTYYLLVGNMDLFAQNESFLA